MKNLSIRGRTAELCSYITSSGIPLIQKMEIIALSFEVSLEQVQKLYARASEVFVTYNNTADCCKWLWICSQCIMKAKGEFEYE